MVPKFPKFKNITIKDKELIDSMVLEYPPYCDFNFLNIYCWNAKYSKTKFSMLNNNLVISMLDFTTDNQICSFIGNNNTLDTINRLLEKFQTLTMVPEICITEQIKHSKHIDIIEDRNNFDYILSLKNLTLLKGRKFKSKKKNAARFLSGAPNHNIKIIDLANSKIRVDLIELCKRWAKLKKLRLEDVRRELYAIKLLLNTAHLCKMVNIGIYDNKKLIGFVTNEIRGEYAMGAFGKANTNYEGIYSYLEHASAKILIKYGCKYLNYEQDLGIINLRKTKLAWRPAFFLKKYIIKKH